MPLDRHNWTFSDSCEFSGCTSTRMQRTEAPAAAPRQCPQERVSSLTNESSLMRSLNSSHAIRAKVHAKPTASVFWFGPALNSHWVANRQTSSTRRRSAPPQAVNRTGTTPCCKARSRFPRSKRSTPPTILQKAPFGALIKRARFHSVHDTNLSFAHLDTFHQRSNQLAA
jgi:hypothetical protein